MEKPEDLPDSSRAPGRAEDLKVCQLLAQTGAGSVDSKCF